MRETLTPRQQAFVEHYAACSNATEAARLTGYKHPRAMGAENLSKPIIREALAKLTAETVSDRIATKKERQEFWTGLMRGVDIYATVDKEVPPVPIEIKERVKASELLGKAQLDFVTKIETGGEGFNLILNMGGGE